MLFSFQNLLQLFLHRNFLEGLNHISFFDVVVILDLETTVISFGNLLHIILESFEGSKNPGKHDHPVSDKPDLGISIDLTVCNHTSRDSTHLGYLEESEKAHERSTGIDPYSFEVWLDWSYVKVKQGKTDEAVELLENAMKYFKSAFAWRIISTIIADFMLIFNSNLNGCFNF